MTDFRHPNVHREFVQFSESQTLHIVSVYSNPYRWRSRRELFNDFRLHIKASPNVDLHVIEVAFGDRPFEVTGNDPNDIQMRTDCALWIKECAVNEAMKRLPPDWKYGGYIDGDFHFTRHDWALEAIHMLQHHSFVQLFGTYADVTPKTSTGDLGHRPYRMNSSFAWNYQHPKEFIQSRKGRTWTEEKGYTDVRKTVGGEFPFGLAPGATGGAWAWRRDAYDTVGGMLDTCILGSGDWHMAFALIQATNSAIELSRCTKPYIDAVFQWERRAHQLSGIPGRSPIGCVDNHAVHFFHGSKYNRAYGDRWGILLKHQFDPLNDLVRDWQGLWRWVGNKPGLRDDVANYFINREEDGGLTSETPLI